MNVKSIARVCYEANRAYCMALGDHSFPTWDMAASWQKDANVKGVQAVVDNPAITPEESHEKWMEEKALKGWKHGPAKVPEKREHPSMVPYAQLNENQRKKDDLFLSVVRALHTPRQSVPDARPPEHTGVSAPVTAKKKKQQKKQKPVATATKEKPSERETED